MRTAHLGILIPLLGISAHQATAQCPPGSPCLASSGLFPVAEDCGSFVNCAHCRPYRQQCPAGTLFDPSAHICNHAHKVKCGGHSGAVGGAPPPAPYNPQAIFLSRSGTLDARRNGDFGGGGDGGDEYNNPTEQPRRQPGQTAIEESEGEERRGAAEVHPSHYHGQAVDSRSGYAAYPVLNAHTYGVAVGSSARGVTATLPERRPPPPQRNNNPSGSTRDHTIEQNGPEYRQSRVPTQEGSTGDDAGNRRFLPVPVHRVRLQATNGQRQPEVAQNERYREPSQDEEVPVDSSAQVEPVSAQEDSAGPRKPTEPEATRGPVYAQRPVDQQRPNRQPHQEHTRSQARTVLPPETDVSRSPPNRFNHSHMAHHPESHAYASTHQIVYDHSHSSHHQDHDSDEAGEDGQHSHSGAPTPDITERLGRKQPAPEASSQSSSNDRGVTQGPRSPNYQGAAIRPGPMYAQNERPIRYDEPAVPTRDSELSTTTPNSRNAAGLSQSQTSTLSPHFDLKRRQQSSSGYVPSYVQEEMADDDVPDTRRAVNYGERVYVRRTETNGVRNSRPDQEVHRTEIVDATGKPADPPVFYTDEQMEDDVFGDADQGGEGAPASLSDEDLKRILENSRAYAYQPAAYSQTLQPNQHYRHSLNLPRMSSSHEIPQERPFAPHFKQPPQQPAFTGAHHNGQLPRPQ